LFTATDFLSLSVFRVVFAAYLLLDYLTGVSPWFDVLFGDTGVMPLAALATNPAAQVDVAISRVCDAIKLPLILPLVYPVALFSFAAGYRTRLSNAVVLALNSYLVWRNPYVVSGSEVLARLLLLWSMFLPMSRARSIDAALDPRPRDRPYPVLPFIALRVQIASLYFFSGLFKLAGPTWRDGSAISLVMRDNVFGGTALGVTLADHFPLLLKGVTYATIAFQLIVPLLIYSPRYNNWTRGFGLAGLAAMHLSFVFLLNIDQFPFLCLTVLTLLIPDAWWDALLRRRRDRLARIAIFYDPGCGFCRRISLLLREFLLTPGTTVLPAYTDPQALSLLNECNSWVVRGVEGGVYLKWRAVAYVLKQSLPFAPLGWLTDLPAFRSAAERLYDFVGSHRRRLGWIMARVFPFRSESSLGTPGKILCGALMGLGLACNITSVPGNGAGPAYSSFFRAVQVWQSWALFAPIPPSFRRQFFVWAIANDGTRFDLMDRSVSPPLWWNSRYRIVFVSMRWLKYFDFFDGLTKEQNEALGQYFCGWQLRPGNPSGMPIHAVEMAEYIRIANGAPFEIKNPIIVRTHVCDQAVR
jgi:hypothetical protein